MAKVTVSAKTHTFTNGTANDATPVDASFVSLFNNDDALKTAVNRLEDGKLAETAVLEFGTGNNNQIRWEDGQLEGSNDKNNFFPLLPVGYQNGCLVSYASANTITIGAGAWADSTGKNLIQASSPLTVDLSASGALGLDTGSEASNTWYYLYLIMNPATGAVSAVFSVTNESASGGITLPSGYTLKRQLPIAIRNDGSSNILPFYVSSGWPSRPAILFDSLLTGATALAPTANTWTDLDLATLGVFPNGVSRQAILNFSIRSNSSTSNTDIVFGKVRPNGSSSAEGMLQAILRTSSAGGVNSDSTEGICATDADGVVEHLRTSSAAGNGSPSMNILVKGFVITEVN